MDSDGYTLYQVQVPSDNAAPTEDSFTGPAQVKPSYDDGLSLAERTLGGTGTS
jgi:hypothetical protein